MTKQKGHDYSTILIWAAAVVSVVRYSAAFIASDMGKIEGLLSEIITFLLGVSGLGMGLLDTIGGTYLFDGWRRVMPKAGDRWPFRFKVLTFFVFSLFTSGIIILAPFTMSRVAHVSIVDILGSGGWLAFWSVLVNAAPALLIGGVAVGNQVVMVTQSPTHGTANEQANGSRTGSPRKYDSLNNSEKYYILNIDSKIAARELGVTPRAIQKWRIRVQEEISKGIIQ